MKKEEKISNGNRREQKENVTEKLEWEEPEPRVVAIANCFVSIQVCTDGYDYSIFDLKYHLLDGGVYDDPAISIDEALREILIDLRNPMFYAPELYGEIKRNTPIVPVNIEDFWLKVEQAEK